MATIVDSFTTSPGGAYGMYGASYTLLGQSFTGDGGTLYSAKFRLNKVGSPTGNVYAKIYAHSGTFGTSSVPTGSALAVSDAIDASTLPSSEDYIEFIFSGANKITLTNTTKYVLVINYTGGDSSNYVRLTESLTTGHAGNFCYYAGMWFYDSGQDLVFYVYKDGTAEYQVNDQRSAKLTGKSTTNSYRSAKIIGKSTSNSSRLAKLTGVVTDIFTDETKASLPSNDANLVYVYNATDITNVDSDNDVFVDLNATSTGYAIHQFKKVNTNSTDKIDITIKVKSTVATSSKNVLLQIYNRNSSAWETIDTESIAGANTEFTLSASVTTNLAYYYDANNVISIRVYQQIA